jgi:hypothetical protein
LDNVDDPATIEALLGRIPGGDVLVTTRRDLTWTRWGLTALRLKVLSPSSSVELLRDLIRDTDINNIDTDPENGRSVSAVTSGVDTGDCLARKGADVDRVSL